jgi:hypothetical protein
MRNGDANTLNAPTLSEDLRMLIYSMMSLVYTCSRLVLLCVFLFFLSPLWLLFVFMNIIVGIVSEFEE